MRDIKFRGKTTVSFPDNKNTIIQKNEWIYGGITFDTDRVWIDVPYYGEINVDKNTVGQYTGLKDKNGKEIYEGNIVTGTEYPFMESGKQNYIGIVVFYEDVAQFGYEYKCVNKNKRGISNGINNEFVANKNFICEELEVIGNLYDNQNLLKED